ncbi:Hypothetical protein D9617_8g049970 [Elsinoe fawcettii]|nr:Hypothetical protein D9617_8g049970 [Elsinoe fawcettii]
MHVCRHRTLISRLVRKGKDASLIRHYTIEAAKHSLALVVVDRHSITADEYGRPKSVLHGLPGGTETDLPQSAESEVVLPHRITQNADQHSPFEEQKASDLQGNVKKDLPSEQDIPGLPQPIQGGPAEEHSSPVRKSDQANIDISIVEAEDKATALLRTLLSYPDRIAQRRAALKRIVERNLHAHLYTVLRVYTRAAVVLTLHYKRKGSDQYVLLKSLIEKLRNIRLPLDSFVEANGHSSLDQRIAAAGRVRQRHPLIEDFDREFEALAPLLDVVKKRCETNPHGYCNKSSLPNASASQGDPRVNVESLHISPAEIGDGVDLGEKPGAEKSVVSPRPSPVLNSEAAKEFREGIQARAKQQFLSQTKGQGTSRATTLTESHVGERSPQTPARKEISAIVSPSHKATTTRSLQDITSEDLANRLLSKYSLIHRSSAKSTTSSSARKDYQTEATASMATKSMQPLERAGHHRYVSFDVLRQLPTLVWKIHDFKKLDGVFNTFFGANKFYSKFPWRFYYFWCNEINPEAPLILMHETAAKEFVYKIHDRFPDDQRIKFPDPAQWPGVIADFKAFPGVEPQILPGEPMDRGEFDAMKGRVQPFEVHPATAEKKDLMEKLRAMIDSTATCAIKNKKEKQAKAQAEFTKTTGEAMQRMQAALGLRQTPANGVADLGLLEVDKPVTLPFHQSAVIICIDVEAHETMKTVITEIGITTLDTNDLRGVPPGPLGINWRKKVRSRHLRTEEYKYHVNHQWISGCPDHFKFGESEFVPMNDLARVVGTCFRPPFSGPPDTTVHPTKVTVFHGPTDAEVRWINPNNGQAMKHNPLTQEFIPAAEQKRNIVFLGHDVDNDIAYLRQVGYNISNLSNIIHVADTCTLYSSLTGTKNKTRLSKILAEIDIEGWYLHNAGNDAWYTMAAAIGMAVGDREGKKFGDQSSRTSDDDESTTVTSSTPVVKDVMTSAEEVKEGNATTTPVQVEEEDLITFDDPEPTTTSDDTARPADDVANAPVEIEEPHVEDTQNYDRLQEEGGMLAYLRSRLRIADEEAKK